MKKPRPRIALRIRPGDCKPRWVVIFAPYTSGRMLSKALDRAAAMNRPRGYWPLFETPAVPVSNEGLPVSAEARWNRI